MYTYINIYKYIHILVGKLLAAHELRSVYVCVCVCVCVCALYVHIYVIYIILFIFITL